MMTPLPRRRVLGAGVAAVAIAIAPETRAAGAAVRVVSPPGALLGLGDYAHEVAQKLGYYGDLDVTLDPGPAEAMAGLKPVDRGAFDLGIAAPDRFALGLDQGMRLVSVWQVQAADPLALAFRKGEAPADVKALAGKTLLLDRALHAPQADAWFAQAGLEPHSVTYVEAGPDWGQALAQGKGDAALTWDGQRAVWAAQGLGFDYLPGRRFSRFPGRSVVARAAELADAAKRPLLERTLRGWAMGLAFAEHNPRAAAAIVSQQVPAIASAMPPAVATAALMQVAAGIRGDWDKRTGWGWQDADSWALLFRTLAQSGRITRAPDPAAVLSNDLVAASNDFDAGKVNADADGFTLPPDFALVDVDALRRVP